MSDRRTRPANDRVVHRPAAGDHPGLEPVDGAWRCIAAPFTDLRAAPAGARDCQALTGDRFLSLERREGWSFGILARDGYVGYLRAEDLGPEVETNQTVAVRSTHLYPRPHFKAEPLCALPFGARLRIVSGTDRFLETDMGHFVPKPHMRAASAAFRDPVTVAQLFFGTPYLWGGDTAWGIDCSGLVQRAFLAAGIPCPRDSDQQEAALGTDVPDGAPVQRGDLFFWKGHVAIAVDPDTLIHANVHHMAVAYEPVDAAMRRIAAQGGGPVTARRRLQLLGLSS